MAMDYHTFKVLQGHLRAKYKEACNALCLIDGVGSGPMGLTPDYVKTLPEYREKKRLRDIAHTNLRIFNGRYLKRFAADIRRERNERRISNGGG